MDLIDFKKHLDDGSNESLRYVDESKSRYVSFKTCFDILSTKINPLILELGTTRSFVNGSLEGCNCNDTKYWDKNDHSKWDWGAGCFTLLSGMMLPSAKITTLDIIKSHIARSKFMTDSLGLLNVSQVISDSLKFLNETDKKYDLIYVDTGDMWPIDPTAQLQLEECQIIVKRNLLKKSGLLLVDDVLNGTPKEMGAVNNKYGKSELSLPYLLKNGFKLIFEGYQYILQS